MYACSVWVGWGGERQPYRRHAGISCFCLVGVECECTFQQGISLIKVPSHRLHPKPGHCQPEGRDLQTIWDLLMRSLVEKYIRTSRSLPYRALHKTGMVWCTAWFHPLPPHTLTPMHIVYISVNLYIYIMYKFWHDYRIYLEKHSVFVSSQSSIFLGD